MGLLLAPSLVFSQEITRGTFNDSTYIAMLAPNGITWNAAEASAVSMGGHLASISSASEDHFVYSLASSGFVRAATRVAPVWGPGWADS